MKSFLSSIAETTRRLNFGIIVHNRTDSTTFSIKKGEVAQAELPSSISSYISDNNCHCAYFRHSEKAGEKVVVIYFVRFILKKQHLVVIIQDTKLRLRVNKFIAAFINSSYGNANTNLAEELLGNFEIERKEYEQKVQKLNEDALFEKAVWQQERDELKGIIAELKGDLENYKLTRLWDKASEEELTAAREAAARAAEAESKYDNLVREMWVIRNDLDDARRENLALSGELSAQKAYGQASSDEEKLKAVQEGIEALKNENTALRRELKEYTEIIAKKDSLLEEHSKTQSTQTINEGYDSERVDELLKDVERERARSAEFERLNEKLREDFNKRGDLLEKGNLELSELQKELFQAKSEVKKLAALKEDLESSLEQERLDAQTQAAGFERELSRLNAYISDIQAKNAALIDEISSLQTFRQELLKILDGIALPIFTIDENDKVVYANNAAAAFSGEMVGRICYETHNNTARCEWCLAEQVRQNEEPAQVKLSSDINGAARALEITFFPVIDIDGTVVKIAEIITDKSEFSELNTALVKTKDRLKELKEQRSRDLNKISELNSSFQEISEEHKKVLGRSNKMIKVIERLVSEDKAKELINARLELTDLRNKLSRTNDMIKNYKYQLDEQLIKYSNLNRRTFLQIERLFNTVKGKASLKGEESVAVLSFLSREFERVRKQFVIEQASGYSDRDIEPPAFESVEEQMLKVKFSGKLGGKDIGASIEEKGIGDNNMGDK
ncbi:MAG: PAS domain-containing protein [Deferribacteraceae bacterium]|jgi:PAS domain-containing protein|nr:PAS domain-containing protein [Deferribacteraceae bacterium]